MVLLMFNVRDRPTLSSLANSIIRLNNYGEVGLRMVSPHSGVNPQILLRVILSVPHDPAICLPVNEAGLRQAGKHRTDRHLCQMYTNFIHTANDVGVSTCALHYSMCY